MGLQCQGELQKKGRVGEDGGQFEPTESEMQLWHQKEQQGWNVGVVLSGEGGATQEGRDLFAEK